MASVVVDESQVTSNENEWASAQRLPWPRDPEGYVPEDWELAAPPAPETWVKAPDTPWDPPTEAPAP